MRNWTQEEGSMNLDRSSLNDIKKDFNSVDYVGNHRFVFNIKGNSYRLVAIISFNAKKSLYQIHRNSCRV